MNSVTDFSRTKTETIFWKILYWCFTSMILCAPAFINHYPLVFSDTATYLDSSFDLKPPMDRPIGYGLFIKTVTLDSTLWTIPIAQAFLLNLLLFWTLKILKPEKTIPFHFFSITLLTLVSSLSWYVSLVMPDVFTAAIILSIFIFLKSPRLKPARIIFLIFLCAWFLSMHFSNILITLGTLFLLLAYYFLSGRRESFPIYLKRAIYPFVACVIALLFIMSYHAANGYGFKTSLSSNVFLAARLSENGILKKYLDRNCDSNPHLLCEMKNSLPSTTSQFLWDPNGILSKYNRDWIQADQALAPVVFDIFTGPEYFPFLIWESGKVTLMQLFAIEISSGIGTQPMNSAPWSAVHRYMGQSEKNEYDSSIREWEFWDRKSTNRMQYWVLGFSVIILFLSAYSGRMKSELRFFVLLVLLSLLVNAFVTGALANVFDRLQARVTWLLVLPALLILWEFAENLQNKLGESKGE